MIIILWWHNNHTLIYTTLNTMVQAHWTSNWKNWINEKSFYYTDVNRKACWCSVRSNPSQIYIDLRNLMNSICGNTLDMIFMKLNIRNTATLVSSGGFWTEQLLSGMMQCWSIQSHKNKLDLWNFILIFTKLDLVDWEKLLNFNQINSIYGWKYDFHKVWYKLQLGITRLQRINKQLLMMILIFLWYWFERIWNWNATKKNPGIYDITIIYGISKYYI